MATVTCAVRGKIIRKYSNFPSVTDKMAVTATCYRIYTVVKKKLDSPFNFFGNNTAYYVTYYMPATVTA